MLEVENKMYDQKRYIEVFNTLPDNILNTFIEYLNRLKIEFLRLTVKRANEVEDLIYRNGLFTATTKFLEMFAQAKAIREGWKKEVDQITWINLQDKVIKEAIKKQEWKNI